MDYNLLIELLKIYKQNKISPIIETNTATEDDLKKLKMMLNFQL